MPRIDIYEAVAADDYAVGKQLIEEYADALGVDLCFQGFAEELADLRGMYGPGGGCLLLARVDADIAGCVGVRELEDSVCEMRRLYVRSPFRGLGVGRCLAEAALKKARGLGYTHVALDTLPQMVEAQALYKSLGFREASRYYSRPIAGVRNLSLCLSSDEAQAQGALTRTNIDKGSTHGH